MIASRIRTEKDERVIQDAITWVHLVYPTLRVLLDPALQIKADSLAKSVGEVEAERAVFEDDVIHIVRETPDGPVLPYGQVTVLRSPQSKIGSTPKLVVSEVLKSPAKPPLNGKRKS